MTRIAALIKRTDLHPPSRHHRGLPKEVGGTQGKMSWPAFLVVEEKPDGVFLFRFTDTCEVVGDTWHLSEEDAKHQATVEYEGVLGPWKEVPDGTPDGALLELLQAGSS